MTTFDVWSLAKLLHHIDHSLEVLKPMATADAETRDTKLSQDKIELWLFPMRFALDCCCSRNTPTINIRQSMGRRRSVLDGLQDRTYVPAGIQRAAVLEAGNRTLISTNPPSFLYRVAMLIY